MELNVKIYSIGETNVVSDKFKKRDFIVVTDEQYVQYLNLQMNQDKCEILNKYSVGQNVKVHLNLKGRLWTNKEGVEVAFNILECWRIEEDKEESQAPILPPAQDVFPPIANADLNADDDNDMPF